MRSHYKPSSVCSDSVYGDPEELTRLRKIDRTRERETEVKREIVRQRQKETEKETGR